MAAKTATENEVLMEPEPPAPTDPRLPLDARQVFKLHKSWKGIKRSMDETGIEMMIRLFRLDENTQKLFEVFREVNSEDLRYNENLEKHGILVVGALDDVIDHIENVDYVIDALKKLRDKHLRNAGFNTQLFWKMEEPFLEAVRLTLGDRYTENMENIYKATIHFLLAQLTNSESSST